MTLIKGLCQINNQWFSDQTIANWSLMLVGPAKKYISPKSVRIGWVYWSSPRVNVTVLALRSTFILTASPKWNCQPLNKHKIYHFGLRVISSIMMIPWEWRSVGGTDLINGVCAFVNSITAQKVIVFYNVKNGDSHPNSFISRLFCYLDANLIIFLSNGRLEQVDRITAWI